jgi:effector-binding domain-containing protein
MAGGSIGAIGSTYLQGQAGMQNLAMQSFGQADRAGIARNDALENQIMGLEQQKGLEAEQKKNATTKSAITIGATALGALAGTMLLPGAGTAAGAGAGAAAAGGSGAAAAGTAAGAGAGAAIAAPAISPVIAALPSAVSTGMSGIEAAMLGSQIGAGIGGIGSSFVGGADYNALQQSIGDTLAGISAISTLQTHRQFLDTFREKYSLLNGEGDKKMFLSLLTLGDYKAAMNFLNSLESPVADAEVIATAEPAVADVAIDPTDPAVTVTDGAEQTQETKTTETGDGNPAEQTPINEPGGNSLVETSRTIPPNVPNVETQSTQELDLSNMTREEISNYARAKIAEAIGAIAPKVDKDTFVTARKKAGAGPAYDAMFDYMEKNGLAYDSPAMKKWVEGKYKVARTYDRFKKIYKAAGSPGSSATAPGTKADVKPKEETNLPALTEDVAAKLTDKELDDVIIQAKNEKPESGVSAPAADEINASVMDSLKTVSKDAFVTARKKAGAGPAYDAMFDYMEKNGLAYDSPAMKKWVESKYRTAGTYNRFKKIYKAAGGQ